MQSVCHSSRCISCPRARLNCNKSGAVGLVPAQSAWRPNIRARSVDRERESSSTPSGGEPEIYLSPSLVNSTTHLYDDDFWSYKPAWCQPTTILATGVTGIIFSYVVLENTLVTGIVSALVAAWWFLFLVLVPGQYKESVREHNKEVIRLRRSEAQQKKRTSKQMDS